jgi:hypothetical protein
MHEKRSRIAHVGEETTAEAINSVSVLIPELETMAKRLLDCIVKEKYPNNIIEQEGWLAFF